MARRRATVVSQPPGRVGTPLLRPLRRRGGEGFGDDLFGQADVATHLAGERREELRPLLAVRPLDRPVGGGDVVRRVLCQRLRRPARGWRGDGSRPIRT